MQKKHIEAGIDLSIDAYNWAKERMQDVDQSVDDAKQRACAVHDRTTGTAFERFGQHRMDAAQHLDHDRPYGIAKAVKVGAGLLTAGLVLYNAIRKNNESDADKTA